MTCESKIDFLLECLKKGDFIIIEFPDAISVVLFKIVEINLFDGDFLASGQKYTSVNSAKTTLANRLSELIILDKVVICLLLATRVLFDR